jgi:hypothetical protein
MAASPPALDTSYRHEAVPAIGPVGDLRGELVADFGRACAQLVEAQLQQAKKDAPRNRATVRACKARVDAVLDLHIEMERGSLT